MLLFDQERKNQFGVAPRHLPRHPSALFPRSNNTDGYADELETEGIANEGPGGDGSEWCDSISSLQYQWSPMTGPCGRSIP